MEKNVQDYCVRHVAALLGGGGGGGDGEDDENPFYNWRGPGGEGEEGDSLVMREETAAQEIRRHERNTFFQVLFFLLCNFYRREGVRVINPLPSLRIPL